MRYPRGADRFVLGPWVKGVNNVKAMDELAGDELWDALNVWVDERGEVLTRPGLEQVFDGVGRGVFGVGSRSGLWFDGGKLWKFVVGGGKEILSDGWSEGPWRFVRLGDRVLFSDGRMCGRFFPGTGEVVKGYGASSGGVWVEVEELGYGNLAEGLYTFGVTVVNELGEESACERVMRRRLKHGGKIELRGVLPDDAVAWRAYASGPNGGTKEMRLIEDVSATVRSFEWTVPEFGMDLETLWLESVPPARLFCGYRGRLYWAKGSSVFGSELMNYGLYNADWGEVGTFSEPVSVLLPCDEGVLVVADRTYLFRGADLEEFSLEVVGDERAVDGSGIEVWDGDIAGAWMSSRGWAILKRNGKVEFVGKRRVEPDVFRRGVSGVVEVQGQSGLVCSLEEFERPKDSVAVFGSFQVKVVKRGLSDD